MILKQKKWRWTNYNSNRLSFVCYFPLFFFVLFSNFQIQIWIFCKFQLLLKCLGMWEWESIRKSVLRVNIRPQYECRIGLLYRNAEILFQLFSFFFPPFVFLFCSLVPNTLPFLFFSCKLVPLRSFLNE